jgi:hypothetical protein
MAELGIAATNNPQSCSAASRPLLPLPLRLAKRSGLAALLLHRRRGRAAGRDFAVAAPRPGLTRPSIRFEIFSEDDGYAGLRAEGASAPQAGQARV